MGSAADPRITSDSMGIIPRVIELLFDTVSEKESNDPASSYKVHVQFLEIYGEDIRDLLDRTKTSKVVIRETAGGVCQILYLIDFCFCIKFTFFFFRMCSCLELEKKS